MSNALAIAAVTATLKGILVKAIDTGDVTTLPPDRAATAGGANRLNLFLYQTTPNASYRNMDLPPPGGSGAHHSPLALNLHYLLTAYGDTDPGETDHQLLGRAMRALHDNAILSPEFIRDSIDGGRLAEADLDRQFERVRITQEPMTLEDMSKLWTAFQTQYRISAVYQASTVLIESAHPRRSALPVLKRGEEDRGVDVAPAPPPRLTGIEYRNIDERDPALPAARVGDIITLFGERLRGVRSVAVFDPAADSPIGPGVGEPGLIARLVPLPKAGDSTLRVALDPSARWVAGGLSIAAEYQTPQGKNRRSQPLRLAVAPDPVVSAGAVSVIAIAEGGKRQLLVNLRHPLRKGSDVFLILTDVARRTSHRPLPMDGSSPRSSPASPVFDISDLPRGRYRVQLRADNVDSLLMERDGAAFRFVNELEVDL